eukprot:gene18291-24750_t
MSHNSKYCSVADYLSLLYLPSSRVSDLAEIQAVTNAQISSRARRSQRQQSVSGFIVVMDKPGVGKVAERVMKIAGDKVELYDDAISPVLIADLSNVSTISCFSDYEIGRMCARLSWQASVDKPRSLNKDMVMKVFIRLKVYMEALDDCRRYANNECMIPSKVSIREASEIVPVALPRKETESAFGQIVRNIYRDRRSPLGLTRDVCTSLVDLMDSKVKKCTDIGNGADPACLLARFPQLFILKPTELSYTQAIFLDLKNPAFFNWASVWVYVYVSIPFSATKLVSATVIASASVQVSV